MSDGWGTGNGWGGPGGQPTGTAAPGSAPGASSTAPDWAALAEQHEQDRRRRKQRRAVGAAVAATVVIGGITATAVTLTGHRTAPTTAAGDSSPSPASDSPSAVAFGGASDPPSPSSTGSATASASPGASAPASASASRPATAKPSARPGGTTPASPSPAGPPDPLTVISAAATDTAPLDPAGLFPSATLTIGGRTWTRVATCSATPCWNATTGHLGDPVTAQGCRALLRVTYTSGTGAVTVGVAVFDAKANADAAAAGHQGQVQGLVPAGNASYCVTDGCPGTHAAIGRYTVYTVSGTTKPGGNATDATATAAGPGFASYAQAQLLARGRR
ncbi:hypothetical protein [Kitasatospora sp. MBT63]|uniref:hypothetical protein n=1 Tax=Kitasatospora sp. MBT63 TaxID=1444768 RepID=UPI00068F3AC7|nr:hypothetical protein [Kitasatospora sp. MBT63]